MSIEQRLMRLEAIEHPTRYLVTWPEHATTPEQIANWQAANPSALVLVILVIPWVFFLILTIPAFRLKNLLILIDSVRDSILCHYFN